MEVVLNQEEIGIAKKIIDIALKKAAESMQFFTQENVTISGVNVNIKNIQDIDEFSDKNDNLTVLITEIRGELGGICFFIFTEREVEEVLKISLPEAIRNDPSKMKTMGDAILLEMDNIITASMITQFSNFFQFKTYGDVPSLKKVESSDLSDFIHQYSKQEQNVLHFKADFATTGYNINPDFIWLLNENYFQGVKKVVSDTDSKKKIESL